MIREAGTEPDIAIVLTMTEAQTLRDELMALRGAASVRLTREAIAMTDRLVNTLIVQIAETTGVVTVAIRTRGVTVLQERRCQDVATDGYTPATCSSGRRT